MDKANNDQLALSKSKFRGLTSVQRKIAFTGLSFLIPFILIYIVYFFAKIAPFGDNTLFISDSRALQLTYLSSLTRAFQGKDDLLYSFQIGIGKNNYESLAGLLNPLNLIVLFFEQSEYANLYSLILAINMSLCGFTMYLFLSHVVPQNGKALLFSTCYSLMGFNVAYCFLSDFIFFAVPLPLIAWGILKILKGKKPWLYLISLSYTILQSYYFGFMLCIASVALFATWYIKDFKEYKARSISIIVNYILSSIVSGLLPAFYWLPTIVQLQGGRLEQSSASDMTFTINMPVNDFYAKFFIGANNLNELMDGLPNIFIGTFALFLVITFFVDKRNTIREKICYGSLIVFYFLTFFIKALSMVVQGFSTTNWFNYRYSFVFSFILLLISFLEFVKFKDIDTKTLKLSGLIYILLAIVVFIKKYDFVDTLDMFISLIILAVILGAFIWSRKKPTLSHEKVFSIVVLAVCCFEMGLNYYISYNNIIKWGTGNYVLQLQMSGKKAIVEQLQAYDSSFYRLGYEFSVCPRGSNDPRLFGYNGTDYFGSSEREFVFDSLSKLGAHRNTRCIWYYKGDTAAYDSLLGVKYVAARRDLTEEKNYELLLENNSDKVFLNPYALPLAFVSDNDVKDVSLSEDPFANQNTVWKALSGIDKDIFTPEEDISFRYNEGKADKDNDISNLYDTLNFTMLSDSNGAVKNPDDEPYVECSFIAQKDGAIYSYNGYFVYEDYQFIEPTKYLGNYKKGDIVTDKLDLPYRFESNADYELFCSRYLVAYADYDVLAEHSKVLQDGAGTMDMIKDSHITGTFTASSDSCLFFTIPYDEGWTLKIDGEETAFNMTADLFMSAPVTEGSHEYELTFSPRKLSTGIYISCGAIVLLAVLIVFNTLDSKKIKSKIKQ